MYEISCLKFLLFFQGANEFSWLLDIQFSYCHVFLIVVLFETTVLLQFPEMSSASHWYSTRFNPKLAASFWLRSSFRLILGYMKGFYFHVRCLFGLAKQTTTDWKLLSLFLVAHIVIYYSADYDELGGIGDLEGEIVLHSAISEPELFAPVTSVRSVFDETWIFSTATAGYSSC